MTKQTYDDKNIKDTIITLSEIREYIKKGKIPFYQFEIFTEMPEETRKKEMLKWCTQYDHILQNLLGANKPAPQNFMVTQEARLTKKELQPFQYIAISMIGYRLAEKPHKLIVQNLALQSPCLKCYIKRNKSGEVTVQRPVERKKTTAETVTPVIEQSTAQQTSEKRLSFVRNIFRRGD